AEKAAIVKVLRIDFPFQILLDLLGLAHSVFFYHLKENTDKDGTISQEIMQVYRDNHECYGYRRITLEFRKTFNINHKKVQRLMNVLDIKGKGKNKRKKYRTYQGEIGRIVDNLLARNFT
ncbi:IS3 family transposase, partial [Haemophilus influenzae]|uniref:IS3 family transposase n=1 Tax=Haemophilus influenzae TaxID=727 RepID=UPI0011B0380C